jgi:hypothetical protein
LCFLPVPRLGARAPQTSLATDIFAFCGTLKRISYTVQRENVGAN